MRGYSFQMFFKRFFVKINDECRIIWSSKLWFVETRIRGFSFRFFDFTFLRILKIRRIRVGMFVGFFLRGDENIYRIRCWRRWSGPFDDRWGRGLDHPDVPDGGLECTSLENSRSFVLSESQEKTHQLSRVIESHLRLFASDGKHPFNFR